MSCQFCKELAGWDDHNRWWQQDDDWVVGPTVGHFTPGYLLMLPIDHIRALAESSLSQLGRAADHIGYVRGVLARQYGPVVVAEHGSGSSCDRGAACCDHAHLHFIPLPDVECVEKVKHEYLRRDENFTILDSLRDLRRMDGSPYLYLSTSTDEHWVWQLNDQNRALFPRQFVRRICATVLGTQCWDWRRHPLLTEMCATRDQLAQEFRPLVGSM